MLLLVEKYFLGYILCEITQEVKKKSAHFTIQIKLRVHVVSDL